MSSPKKSSAKSKKAHDNLSRSSSPSSSSSAAASTPKDLLLSPNVSPLLGQPGNLPVATERGAQVSDMVSVKAISSGAYLRSFVDKRRQRDSLRLEMSQLSTKLHRCKSEPFLASWDYGHFQHEPTSSDALLYRSPSADQIALLDKIKELRRCVMGFFFKTVSKRR